VTTVNANFQWPPWSVPLLGPARYKGAKGGRGGGKSHFVADRLICDSLEERGLLTVSVREVQRTLSESSKRLLETKLAQRGLLMGCGFKVFEDCIETPGDGLMIFRGMQSYNAESIKSLEGYKRLWWEEAQGASATSLNMLRPTLRVPGAEMYFTWNPKDAPDPDKPETSIDGLFGGACKTLEARLVHVSQLPGGGALTHCDFDDNPWLPPDLAKEEEYDRTHRTAEDYLHIWRGAYSLRSEARVFHNWRVQAFESPSAGAVFNFGGDFGFAVDPTVLVRNFIGDLDADGRAIPNEKGRCLFIDHEAYQIGCEIDHTPALFASVPGSTLWPIVADSARPETISYLKRNGYPRVEAATKGPGSVEEGIEFLKNFTIIVHPRCTHTARELTLYSFKVHPKTGIVLPELVDKENHVIDAVRYSIERRRKARGFFG
jgi:phage terminase large subunit